MALRFPIPRRSCVAASPRAEDFEGLRNGPFTERWAYLVAEIAGQAAIDVLLGPTE